MSVEVKAPMDAALAMSMEGAMSDTADANYRFYSMTDSPAHVVAHYRAMRTHQTLEYVQRMHREFIDPLPKSTRRLSLRDVMHALDHFVDASDPDTSLANNLHDLQTAEAIRKAGLPDWMQLVGLLHDCGKLIYLFSNAENGHGSGVGAPQWGIGGDTWVVGARIPDCVVLPELNALNPDMAADAATASELGVYERNCGIMNLTYAFGHDEYMYAVCKNGTTLPDAALQMIKLHSCYPLHREGAYRHFFEPGDDEIIERVQKFNAFDLYTKHDKVPDMEKLLPYYEKLWAKYVPSGFLQF